MIELLTGDIELQQPDYSYRPVNPYTVKKNREGDQLDRSKDNNRDVFTIGNLCTGEYTNERLKGNAIRQKRYSSATSLDNCSELPRVLKNWTSENVRIGTYSL